MRAYVCVCVCVCVCVQVGLWRSQPYALTLSPSSPQQVLLTTELISAKRLPRTVFPSLGDAPAQKAVYNVTVIAPQVRVVHTQTHTHKHTHTHTQMRSRTCTLHICQYMCDYALLHVRVRVCVYVSVCVVRVPRCMHALKTCVYVQNMTVLSNTPILSSVLTIGYMCVPMCVYVCVCVCVCVCVHTEHDSVVQHPSPGIRTHTRF